MVWTYCRVTDDITLWKTTGVEHLSQVMPSVNLNVRGHLSWSKVSSFVFRFTMNE